MNIIGFMRVKISGKVNMEDEGSDGLRLIFLIVKRENRRKYRPPLGHGVSDAILIP